MLSWTFLKCVRAFFYFWQFHCYFQNADERENFCEFHKLWFYFYFYALFTPISALKGANNRALSEQESEYWQFPFIIICQDWVWSHNNKILSLLFTQTRTWFDDTNRSIWRRSTWTCDVGHSWRSRWLWHIHSQTCRHCYMEEHELCWRYW